MRHEDLGGTWCSHPQGRLRMHVACLPKEQRKSHETEDQGKLRSVCDLISNLERGNICLHIQRPIILLKWAVSRRYNIHESMPSVGNSNIIEDISEHSRKPTTSELPSNRVTALVCQE